MKFKKTISILLALIFITASLVSCGGDKAPVPSGTKLLSFSEATSVEEMQKYDGMTVTIIGYMSTLSPVSGNFMYLMNLPYQNCPFCIPNTTQLSNTMAVYAPSGKEFEFTDLAIQVTGIMEFGDYTDEFGYEYAYRIKDASYTQVDMDSLSDEMRLWQQLAATDVISDVYAMYEYVNFLCYWGTYTAEFNTGSDYLYPEDALYFIETEGYQFNYGHKDGYFDDMISTIEEVDDTAFSALVQNIRDAKALADKMYSALKNGEYTAMPEYSGHYGDGRNQYRVKDYENVDAQMTELYRSFSKWLSEWEL